MIRLLERIYHLEQLLIGFLSLFLGCLIYIAFRQETLILFTWFDISYLSEFRLITLPFSQILPNWFLYSLPDGLWVFSYVTISLVYWKNVINKRNIFWIIIIPCIGLSSEIGQLFNILPGTFDKSDLLFYFVGTISPFLLFKSDLFNINIIKQWA